MTDATARQISSLLCIDKETLQSDADRLKYFQLIDENTYAEIKSKLDVVTDIAAFVSMNAMQPADV